MKRFFLFLIFMIGASISLKAQELEDSKEIISRINTKFLKVRDYQVDCLIDARISFLKILPQHAKIYFKQPDKFRLKSKGIAILPKQNADNLFTLLANEKSYQAFIGGKEVIGKYPVTIINIIPLNNDSDLVFAKIWVDAVRDLVLKAQLTTKTNGTILVDYEFISHPDYLLPDKITFTVEVKKFKIPKAIAADINSPSKTKGEESKEPKTGKIFVSLSNYIINKGFPDDVFR